MGEDPCKKSSSHSFKPNPKNVLKYATSLKEKIPKFDSIPKYILKSLPVWKNFYRKQIDSSSNIIKMWMYRNCDPTKMADKPAGSPSRPMKYPYTFSAKFSQFPLSYYFKNQWIWKYYFLSVAACVPVFYSIHKLANSPGNVAKWAEIRRKEAAEHH